MKIGSRNIDAVIFDLDGTLYSLKRLKFRIALRNSGYIRFFMALHKVRKDLAGLDLKSKKAFYTLFLKKMAESTGKNSESIREWYFDIFYKGFISILSEKYKKRDGLDSVLIKIRDDGIKTAVLSDFSFVKDRLGALSINPAYFDFIGSNEDYGALKPSPRPFVAISKKMNISPESILVVGDRDDTDGAGAEKAGMGFYNVGDNADWTAFCDAVLK